MDWNMIIGLILKIVAIISGLIAFIAWLTKSFIKWWFDKGLEKHKEKLQEQLSSYKHELEKERIRLTISYGGIFEKQAEAMLEMYDVLNDLENIGNALIESLGNGENEYEKKKEYFTYIAKLKTIYIKNRILLPKEIDSNINNYFKKYKLHGGNAINYNKQANLGKQISSQERVIEFSDKTEIEIGKMVDELPNLKNEIISSMKKKLSIEVEDDPKTNEPYPITN